MTHYKRFIDTDSYLQAVRIRTVSVNIYANTSPCVNLKVLLIDYFYIYYYLPVDPSPPLPRFVTDKDLTNSGSTVVYG